MSNGSLVTSARCVYRVIRIKFVPLRYKSLDQHFLEVFRVEINVAIRKVSLLCSLGKTSVLQSCFVLSTLLFLSNIRCHVVVGEREITPELSNNELSS